MNKYLINLIHFFSTIGSELETKIPATHISPLNYLTQPNYASINNIPSVNDAQIEDIIKTLNPVGGGMDKISTKILIGTYRSILQHLTYFFNLCLNTAIFPDTLKSAVIIPVYKGGENNKFTNYRPISLLPIFSKVLERLIHFWVSSFLNENNIMHPLQFGFRKKHSAYMPIALMHNEVTKSLVNNKLVCTLYLDLRKLLTPSASAFCYKN